MRQKELKRDGETEGGRVRESEAGHGITIVGFLHSLAGGMRSGMRLLYPD